MMEGRVNERLEAVVPLQLALRSGEAMINAIVDTGFSGSVSVPESLAEEMDLSPGGFSNAYLADGSRLTYRYFRGRITWHGREVSVPISMIGGEVLIGMALLERSRLSIEIKYAGSALIDPLP